MDVPSGQQSAAEKKRKLALATLQAETGVGVEQRLSAFRYLLKQNYFASYECLLPALLRLDGKPYTLKDHFPFETLFKREIPRRRLLLAGRQVSKSTSLSSSGVLMCGTIPHFKMLYVAPLYEQIRRFSANYVRPLIETSPIKSLWSDTSTVNNVLQRSFRNGSMMHFSYAADSADRIRGLSVKAMDIDEVQDMDAAVLPVIRETMSAAVDWGIELYSGTPKSFENLSAALHLKSSQAEWFIPCRTPGCGHWNIPALEYDAEKMLGPYHSDISEKIPGTVCAKCAKPIFPRDGHWVHKFPDRALTFPGYHLPQIIFPYHYAYPHKWAEVVAKSQGGLMTPAYRFWNEVMGTAYDTSTKLVSFQDLVAASVLPKRDMVEAAMCLRDYMFRVLAIDWGGGGIDEVSFTTIAVLGWDGEKIDVLWGKRLMTPNDHLREAAEVREIMNVFQPHLLVHDYTGAGNLRETVLVQSGVPIDRVMPICYGRTAASAICKHVPATPQHPRNRYQVDKARSLQLTAAAIKMHKIRFYKDDMQTTEPPALIRDFLALVEEKLDTKRAGDVYMIYRNPMLSDDFAQAVNMGCIGIWHTQGVWPQFAGGYPPLTREQEALICPTTPSWEFEEAY